MHAKLGSGVLLISKEQRLLDALDAAFRARWPNLAFLTALDSMAGLQMAGACRLKLVVLDIDLSERDGFER